MTLALLDALLLALTVVAVAPVSYALAMVQPLARPTLGPRGVARTAALQHGFAAVDAPLRYGAALLARVPCDALRAHLERALVHSGGWLGLCADELLALCVLGACAGLALGAAFTTLDLPASVAVCGALIGAATPALRLQEVIIARRRAIIRRLPSTIDLVALCMGAGLDFKGALELVTHELQPRADHDDALGVELKRVLQELSIGSTRKQALLGMLARAPSEAMHELVSAVAQAEQKGNPLAPVLEVQARLMRMRRSVLAEEAAARAGVLLMLPLMLLLGAILLVLFAPFVIDGMGL